MQNSELIHFFLIIFCLIQTYLPNHLKAPLLTGPASAVTFKMLIPELSHLHMISSIISATAFVSIVEGVKWNPTTCFILGPPMLAIWNTKW